MNFSNITSKTVFWLCMLVLAFFVIAYSSSLLVLSVIWSGVESAGYSHGFLVLACTVYLLFLKKEEFKRLTPEANFWALLPLVGFSLLWFVAMVGGIQTVQLAVLPFLLLFSILLLLGNQFFKIAFTPIVLLFFALPVWNYLLPYLQDITTQVAHFNLKLIGRPVFVQEHYLHLPGGTFLVEESCSGLRFLLVSTTLAFLYTAMNSLNIRQSTLLVSISIILALIANWVRVLVVVLIGDYTNMQSSLVNDHANLGWGIFLVLVLVPFFLITKFFPEPLPLRASSSTSQLKKLEVSQFYKVFILVCCAVLTGPLLYMGYGHQESTQANEIKLPMELVDWESSGENLMLPALEWRPSYVGASEDLYGRYTNKEKSMDMHIIYYADQRQNAELINVENQIVDDEQWFIVRASEEKITLNLEGGLALSLLALEVQSRQGQHKKVWYWYNVGGTNTVNPYMAKLLQIRSLLNHRADASLIAMAINCDSNCNNEENQLKSFLKVMYPMLAESF